MKQLVNAQIPPTMASYMDFFNDERWNYLKDNKGKFIKSRLWEVVAYEESSNINDIREYLNSNGYQGWISPIHNKDIHIDTGELKKAHYHIYILSTGAVYPHTPLKLCRDYGCINPVKKDNLQGSFDYSYHKNEVFELNGKYRYNFNDIVTFGSFDKSKYNVMDSTPCNIRDLILYIKEKKCFNVAQLTDEMLSDNKIEYLTLFMKNTYFFKMYMDGMKKTDV